MNSGADADMDVLLVPGKMISAPISPSPSASHKSGSRSPGMTIVDDDPAKSSGYAFMMPARCASRFMVNAAIAETWRGIEAAPEFRCSSYSSRDYPYSPS